MGSNPDYKERMVIEYNQVNERFKKLTAMIEKYHNGTLDFKPDCSIDLLEEQEYHMACYLQCLRTRAKVEHVDLGD